jgi:hypothetical protein
MNKATNAARQLIDRMRRKVNHLNLPIGGLTRVLIGDKAFADAAMRRAWKAERELRELREVKQSAYRLGECRYLLRGKLKVVTEPQDHLLQAIIAMGGAATLDELREKTGIDGANKVLDRLLTTQPAFRPFVKLPGKPGKKGRKPGQNGYRTTIRPARGIDKQNGH